MFCILRCLLIFLFQTKKTKEKEREKKSVINFLRYFDEYAPK
jgi:hypothetical protein